MSKPPRPSLTLVRIGKVADALPKVFNLMPSTDYQKMVSHSAAELQRKAWTATGEQMREAMDSVAQNARRKHA